MRTSSLTAAVAAAAHTELARAAHRDAHRGAERGAVAAPRPEAGSRGPRGRRAFQLRLSRRQPA
jgi:hypothetical protein